MNWKIQEVSDNRKVSKEFKSWESFYKPPLEKNVYSLCEFGAQGFIFIFFLETLKFTHTDLSIHIHLQNYLITCPLLSLQRNHRFVVIKT